MDLASKMDYLETKVEYNNARVELRKEEDLLNANILEFKNLIGSDNFELASFDTTKKINVVVDDINRSIANVDNMYSNMLIKKSESTAAFHKSEMNNAMSKHLPTFDFEASYSKYDIDNPSSDYNNDNKKLLHKNDGENGLTYFGIYQSAHPNLKIWKIIEGYLRIEPDIK